MLGTPSDPVGTLHKVIHSAITGMAIAVNFIIQARAKANKRNNVYVGVFCSKATCCSAFNKIINEGVCYKTVFY